MVRICGPARARCVPPLGVVSADPSGTARFPGLVTINTAIRLASSSSPGLPLRTSEHLRRMSYLLLSLVAWNLAICMAASSAHLRVCGAARARHGVSVLSYPRYPCGLPNGWCDPHIPGPPAWAVGYSRVCGPARARHFLRPGSSSPRTRPGSGTGLGLVPGLTHPRTLACLHANRRLIHLRICILVHIQVHNHPTLVCMRICTSALGNPTGGYASVLIQDV